MTALVTAALRSAVWFGAALWLAERRSGGRISNIRTDTVGWLSGGILLVGLVLHMWANVTLFRGERLASASPGRLVTDGPFRYVRNPIYLAGVPLFAGASFLYPTAKLADLVGVIVLMVSFHALVVFFEEPKLRARLGAPYEEYCRRVPRWLPAVNASVGLRSRPHE